VKKTRCLNQPLFVKIKTAATQPPWTLLPLPTATQERRHPHAANAAAIAITVIAGMTTAIVAIDAAITLRKARDSHPALPLVRTTTKTIAVQPAKRHAAIAHSLNVT